LVTNHSYFDYSTYADSQRKGHFVGVSGLALADTQNSGLIIDLNNDSVARVAHQQRL